MLDRREYTRHQDQASSRPLSPPLLLAHSEQTLCFRCGCKGFQDFLSHTLGHRLSRENGTLAGAREEGHGLFSTTDIKGMMKLNRTRIDKL